MFLNKFENGLKRFDLNNRELTSKLQNLKDTYQEVAKQRMNSEKLLTINGNEMEMCS